MTFPTMASMHITRLPTVGACGRADNPRLFALDFPLSTCEATRFAATLAPKPGGCSR